LQNEVIPTNKVVWLVLDNHFNFTEDKSEWKGTKVIFEISKKDGKTEVRFTHLGLVPEYECFNVCSNAWGSYINGSLRSLITAGTLTDSDGPPDMTWETAEDVDKVKINKQSDFALVAFSGASHSQELLDLASDQAREAALLKQLSGVYPEIAAQITNSKFMDWPSKLFTQGSSYFPAPDEVTSWGPSWKTGYLDWLHFAGEHTSYAFMGYMEGALSSGFRLARRLAVRDQLLP
jgi:hypothetical protein